MTAVMFAAREGHYECLKLLTSAKDVRTDLKNGAGQGLMNLAKNEECAAIIKALSGSDASDVKVDV